MARAPASRRVAAVVSSAEVDRGAIAVRYSPVRGDPPEVRDRIRFGPERELAVVNEVGRFLRVLRAGRVRAPSDPYALHDDLERAATLVRSCRGTAVTLVLKRRFNRALTIWTEAGVEKIGNVLDIREERDALAVRRAGGQSPLRIPRTSLIRYEAASHEFFEVVSIEPTQQMQLP